MIELITDFIAPYVSIIEPYAAVYGAVVALCTAIVKVTPSVNDDAVWAKILKVLDYFSTAFLKSDAEKLKK